MNDRFSKCHPLVNFLFFAGAIGTTVLIQHPAFLLTGVITGVVYYLLLNGKKGLKTLALLVPVFVIIAAVNPVFNTMGQRVLFTLFGRPYTLEALYYGIATAGMFAGTMVWFGCYNKVLTGDKFTALFGNVIPAVSLLLVMVFRMVPGFVAKGRQLLGARQSIGKGTGENASVKEKMKGGATVLGALATWALEGSIVTADSMRARGYGSAKRTSFMIYRMTAADYLVLAAMAALFGAAVAAVVLGQAAASFVPAVDLAPVSWGWIAYTAYLLLPTVLHIKENVKWHISRSKI